MYRLSQFLARPHYKGGSGVGFPLLTYDDTIECKDSSQVKGPHRNPESGMPSFKLLFHWSQVFFEHLQTKKQLNILGEPYMKIQVF